MSSPGCAAFAGSTRDIRRVLVVGGYGNFGRRMVQRLRLVPRLQVIVAGRSARRAARYADSLGLEHACVNTREPGLEETLTRLRIDLVIAACGPFAPGDYALARAAVATCTHYLDISDHREHVCGIRILNDAARDAGVLVASGVSSVPALSSAVVDHYSTDFACLQRIEYGITTSELTPGRGAIEAILGYCGKPIRSDSGPRTGWQHSILKRFADPLGWRWLVCCDVPDLDLFPVRYPDTREIVFRAGAAGLPNMFGMWMLSWLIRLGIVRSALPFAELLGRLARACEIFGHGRSGMYVRLEGDGGNGAPLNREWQLIAEENHGPMVPALGVVALVRKMATAGVPSTGAMPAVGLLSLREYLSELDGLAIHVVASARSVHSGISLARTS